MKLKFLLIDIGYDCEELNEPLGIETILGYLKVFSPLVESDIYSEIFDNADFEKLLCSFTPDIIGFSTHINSWERFTRFYNKCNDYFQKKKKKPFYIVGGILGTYEYVTILKTYSNVVCSIGEGEESLSKLLNIAANTKEITYNSLTNKLLEYNCPNLALLVNNRIQLTERRVLGNLEKLNIVVDHRYLPSVIRNNGIVRMEASRGCPWNKCSFCVLNWKYAGKKWRPFSISKIVNEIIELSSMGAKTIFFTDEEFIAGSKERLFTLISRIQQEKNKNNIRPDIEFVASTSVQAISGKYEIDRESTEELLKNMKEIGFRSFFLGIESGSNTQLKRFNKGIDVTEIELSLELLKRLGIEIDIGYILFDPFLTLEELKESLLFLKRNGLENHISRFAKRLRLVPYTPFFNYINLKKEQYDSNNVEQMYLFNDANIQKIYDEYSNWEKDHLSTTHLLQASVRNLQTSQDRNEKKCVLGQIRTNEYEMLSNLIQNNKTKKRSCLCEKELLL